MAQDCLENLVKEEVHLHGVDALGLHLPCLHHARVLDLNVEAAAGVKSGEDQLQGGEGLVLFVPSVAPALDPCLLL